MHILSLNTLDDMKSSGTNFKRTIMHNFISKYTRYGKKWRSRFLTTTMHNVVYDIPDNIKKNSLNISYDVKSSGTNLKDILDNGKK